MLEMVTEITVLPTGADIDQEDVDAFSIKVSYRGKGCYAVLKRAWCLGSDGTWDAEPNPSGRSQEWLSTHRWSLEEGLAKARALVDHQTIGGRTWQQWQDHHSGAVTT